jgi:hypothetical protein
MDLTQLENAVTALEQAEATVQPPAGVTQADVDKLTARIDAIVISLSTPAPPAVAGPAAAADAPPSAPSTVETWTPPPA